MADELDTCNRYAMAGNICSILSHVNAGKEFYRRPDNCHALYFAASSGNISITRFLIERGASSRSMLEMAATNAAQNGHDKLLKILVNEYNAPVDNGIAACNAIVHGFEDIAMFILSRGVIEYAKKPMLLHSIIEGLWKVADELLAQGIEILKFNEAAYCEIVDGPVSRKMMRYLVRAGAWFEWLNPRDYAFEISRSRHPDVQAYLLQKNIHPLPPQAREFTDIAIVSSS